MPIHKHTTITTGCGWIALDGSCLPVSRPSEAMSTLMQHATWLRTLYNTVITRDAETYYRFLLKAYDRGYTLVGRDTRYLGVEACSTVVLDKQKKTIDRVWGDSAINNNTLIPRRYIYSVIYDILYPATRAQFFSENLKPPVDD